MQFVFVGLSNFNSRQVDEVIEKAKVKPAVNQVECHPYLNQEQLIEHCKKRNVVGEFIIDEYRHFANSLWLLSDDFSDWLVTKAVK